MGLVIYTGKELKAEIETDYKCFSDMDISVAEWYGTEYKRINDENYYLVSSELVIHEESDLPEITSDGIKYQHKGKSLKELELAQTLYCEKYGIIESTLKGVDMIYYTSYPQGRETYKAVVDLRNGKEKRTKLSRYYKKGELNMCM